MYPAVATNMIAARFIQEGDRISLMGMLATVESVEDDPESEVVTVHLSTLTAFRTRAFSARRFDYTAVVRVYR